MKLNNILEHKLFLGSLLAKGIYGLIETILGISIIISKSRIISRIVQYAFAGELLENPKDFLGNFFMNIANQLMLHSYIFVGSYFIVHGLVNMGITAALLSKKKWIYPAVAIMLGLFTIYQIILIIRAPSVLLILTTLIDIVILALLRLEYKKKK